LEETWCARGLRREGLQVGGFRAHRTWIACDSTAEAEAEARAGDGDGDGDGGVADDAASDNGEVVEEPDVSQAEGQTRDEGSAAGKDLEPTAI
jgi:hypothetical protein